MIDDNTDIQETYRVTAEELRSYVERIEKGDQDKKEIAEYQKEIFAEAKSQGYDTKVIRKIVALRRKDSEQIAEEDAILELYKEALGM